MKIIVHIGAPKTGSSAIQTFLSINRAALLDVGGIVYPSYPHDKAAQRGHPTTGNAGVLARLIAAGSRAEAEAWVRDHLGPVSPDATIILSSELFWAMEGRELHLLKELLAGYGQIQLVFYAGCQVRQLASGYWQLVKNNGGSKPFREFLGPRLASFEYFRRTRLMTRVLGAGNVVLRPYDRSQFPEQNIIFDFLAFIGLGADIWKTFDLTRSKVNETADASLYLLSLLNNRADGVANWVRDAYKSTETFIEDDFLQPARRPETLLSSHDLQGIADHFKEDNDRLRRFLRNPQIDINKENAVYISKHVEASALQRPMSISEAFLFECVIRLQKEVDDLRSKMAEATKS